jgi:hypothetical protein
MHLQILKYKRGDRGSLLLSHRRRKRFSPCHGAFCFGLFLVNRARFGFGLRLFRLGKSDKVNVPYALVRCSCLPLTERLDFKAVLQKGNRFQLPKLVRWKFKLETSQILKVTVFPAKSYMGECFYA